MLDLGHALEYVDHFIPTCSFLKMLIVCSAFVPAFLCITFQSLFGSQLPTSFTNRSDGHIGEDCGYCFVGPGLLSAICQKKAAYRANINWNTDLILQMLLNHPHNLTRAFAFCIGVDMDHGVIGVCASGFAHKPYRAQKVHTAQGQEGFELSINFSNSF